MGRIAFGGVDIWATVKGARDNGQPSLVIRSQETVVQLLPVNAERSKAKPSQRLCYVARADIPGFPKITQGITLLRYSTDVLVGVFGGMCSRKAGLPGLLDDELGPSRPRAMRGHTAGTDTSSLERVFSSHRPA